MAIDFPNTPTENQTYTYKAGEVGEMNFRWTLDFFGGGYWANIAGNSFGPATVAEIDSETGVGKYIDANSLGSSKYNNARVVATYAEVDAGTNNEKFISPYALELSKYNSELEEATPAEINAGILDGKYISPLGLEDSEYSPGSGVEVANYAEVNVGTNNEKYISPYALELSKYNFELEEATVAEIDAGNIAGKYISPLGLDGSAYEYGGGGGDSAIPSGTRMVFYQAAAPAGWTTLAEPHGSESMLRVVNSGGGFSGTDDPILNDKIIAHTHGYSGNVAYNGSHHHSIHDYPLTLALGTFDTNKTVNYGGGSISNNTNTVSDHTHSYSGTTANNTEGNLGTWSPRYIDVVLGSYNG